MVILQEAGSIMAGNGIISIGTESCKLDGGTCPIMVFQIGITLSRNILWIPTMEKCSEGGMRLTAPGIISERMGPWPQMNGSTATGCLQAVHGSINRKENGDGTVKDGGTRTSVAGIRRMKL